MTNDRKSRMEETAQNAGEDLDETTREQMEKQAEAEHATGEEREELTEEAEEMD